MKTTSNEELIELLRFDDQPRMLDSYSSKFREFKTLIDNGLIEELVNCERTSVYALSKRGKIVVDGVMAYVNSCCCAR